MRVLFTCYPGLETRDQAAATEVTMGGPYGILTMIGAIIFILIMVTVSGQY